MTFTVEALDPDVFHTCQGNPSVAANVDLGEPRGDRPILDGSCFENSASTSYVCEPDGERVTASGLTVADPFSVDS